MTAIRFEHFFGGDGCVDRGETLYFIDIVKKLNMNVFFWIKLCLCILIKFFHIRPLQTVSIYK